MKHLKISLLLFLILIISYKGSIAQQIKLNSNTRFEIITIHDGLPENSVFASCQDYLGYIWLDTYNGLVRYDGQNYRVFSYNPEDPNSCKSSAALLYEDKYKELWKGNEHGLSKFERSTEKFRLNSLYD